jgi:hypothetical protein
MPHASLKLIPGVDQNRTPALNEAAISVSNLIRFTADRQGVALPQKLGGWTRYIPQATTAIARALWAWADTNSSQYLAVGCEDGIFTINSGNLINRSPQVYSATIPMSFNTTINTNQVKIDDTGSNITNYDSVFISTHVSIGGLVVFGFYPATAITANQYSVFETNVIGIPVLATSTVVAGGAVATFTTALSTPSVVVTLNNHGLSVGDTFPVLVSTTVGGVTLYGNFDVKTVLTVNTFVITAPNSATSVATVSINGGLPRITYYIGQNFAPVSGGYGAGGYGSGGYGSGVFTSNTGRSFATTAASCVGTTATVSFTGNYVVPVGSQVTVAGVTPAGYNGKWTVTASTAGATSTVSFTVPSTLGVQTVAGTISISVWGFAGPASDWSLDNWGEYLIDSPVGGPIYYWNPGDGGQYSNIVPNAPTVNEGCFVAMPERQIIAYGSTFTGIQDPLLVRWCDISNFTSWIGTVTNQAGSYRIPKGSRIVGGIQGPQQGILWTDLAVWSMQYINLPLVWSFNEVGNGCGLIGRKAAASMSGTVYWMSQTQFFTLSGSGISPLPCPVWDVVFQDLDADYVDRIRCATNSRFGEVSWFFPTIGSGGIPNRYVKYNTLIGQWDYGDLARTAWLDQSVLGAPIGASQDRFILQHETSTNADGEAMNSYFETGYFTLQDGDMQTFVDQLWPDMKWGYYDGTQNANVLITFYVTDYPGETPRVYGPYTVTQATTFITPRFRGRLVKVRVESNDIGSFWRLGNIRYRLQPDGKF